MKHALMHDEGSIYEYESGVCGVDLPSLHQIPTRTGLPARDTVGLPQVSEPQVMRHYTRLSRMNFSNEINIYPLGSCTMKYNPRINEEVASLSGIANIHPMQPIDTIQGALQIIFMFQEFLGAISGLPAVSLVPAAGAHGEWAGMRIIRKAHQLAGRDPKVVLIPDSAHGTNPATASACGYDVITVNSNKNGTIDMDHLRSLINNDIAAIMMTNPNTCGIFEKDIKEVADLVHSVNGYFYYDGANFNAIAGRMRPADFGVDVMHFNLHKTFSTPHGGGGPGAGPIAVSEKLRGLLPLSHVIRKKRRFSFVSSDTETKNSIGRVKAFHGHFAVVARALSYVMSLGIDGLKEMSGIAVLNANYILNALKDVFHVPFDGFCMHECLLTDKLQNEAQNIDTNMIAKALIQKGIHPMTVYFPMIVSGAMLIEPTESESKDSLDALVAAMRGIAGDVKNNIITVNNPLPNNSFVGKVDEAGAARNPILKFGD